MQTELVFDDERGHYHYGEVGWDGDRRIDSVLVHIDLTGDTIWIQRNWTETRLAEELVKGEFLVSISFWGSNTPICARIPTMQQPDLSMSAKHTGSLLESLAALQNDHEFLLKGGVFSADLIETYIEYKRKSEYDQVTLRLHACEFPLYLEI